MHGTSFLIALADLIDRSNAWNFLSDLTDRPRFGTSCKSYLNIRFSATVACKWFSRLRNEIFPKEINNKSMSSLPKIACCYQIESVRHVM